MKYVPCESKKEVRVRATRLGLQLYDVTRQRWLGRVKSVLVN